MVLNRRAKALVFTPRNNMVLVKQLEPEDRSPGGVVIPETARENIAMGKVVALGPGKEIPHEYREERKPDGSILYRRYENICGIAVGEIVFFNGRKAIFTPPGDGDAVMALVDADDVLATVKIPSAEEK